METPNERTSPEVGQALDVASETASPHPGLVVFALRTPTLPPATHTNTSVVGFSDLYVVDPATPHAAERARLLVGLEEIARTGDSRFRGIVLTHHHTDHVGAAEWLADRLGVPVLAHPRTAELLREQLRVHRYLEEGESLSVGNGESWEVLHTPGHASGHIVLWNPDRGTIIAGDMVASVGTILIDPPDGHMATYLGQLERLASLEPARLVPAHGAVIDAAVERLRFYLAHRLGRELKVRAAVGPVPRDLMELTRVAYDDVPPWLHALASRSTLAHLIKLEEELTIRRLEDGRWRSVAASG